MLVSKCKITHENLSDYQLEQIKKKRQEKQKIKRNIDKVYINQVIN